MIWHIVITNNRASKMIPTTVPEQVFTNLVENHDLRELVQMLWERMSVEERQHQLFLASDNEEPGH